MASLGHTESRKSMITADIPEFVAFFCNINSLNFGDAMHVHGFIEWGHHWLRY